MPKQELDSPLNTPHMPPRDILSVSTKAVQKILTKLTLIGLAKEWSPLDIDENSVFYSRAIDSGLYHEIFERVQEYILSDGKELQLSSQENENYFIGGLMLFDKAIKAAPSLLAPNNILLAYCACLGLFWKANSDFPLSNRDLSEVFGLSLEKFNAMEIAMLFEVLNGKAAILANNFDDYKVRLVRRTASL